MQLQHLVSILLAVEEVVFGPQRVSVLSRLLLLLPSPLTTGKYRPLRRPWAVIEEVYHPGLFEVRMESCP